MLEHTPTPTVSSIDIVIPGPLQIQCYHTVPEMVFPKVKHVVDLRDSMLYCTWDQDVGTTLGPMVPVHTMISTVMTTPTDNAAR